MNKTLKKTLFLYVIVHIVVLLTVVIGWFPSIETHSKTKEEMDLFFIMRNDRLKEKANDKRLFLMGVNRYLQDSLRINYVATENTTRAEWERISSLLSEWFKKHPTTDDFFRDYRRNLVIRAAISQSVNEADQERTIIINSSQKDQVSKWFLISSEESQSQRAFWPFVKYKAESFNYYSYTTTFLGVFSGYGIEEFLIYTLLPFILIGLVYFYKRFVNN